ncbi:MAG: protein-L-isoaspartate O-methyltransferase [Candidatus Hydrothermarchaeota archaeon]
MKNFYEKEREKMVNFLERTGYITSDKVRAAMLKVPRHLFVPENQRIHAYEDRPLYIGMGQTISAPHMVAIMCEKLDLKPAHRVLEVGAGSGYHAAIISEIVGKDGYVISIERIKELADFAQENLRRSEYSNRVKVVVGDGTLGYKEGAPYDRILVTAGSPKVPPPLTEQLKIKGKLLIPIGDRTLQHLIKVEKVSEKELKEENLGPCVFVPLIGKEGWES